MPIILHREQWDARELTDNVQGRLLRLLYEAKDSLHMVADHVPPAPLVLALTERAAEGVAVEVLLGSRLLGTEAGVDFMGRLTGAHITVRFVARPLTEVVLVDMVRGPGDPDSFVAHLLLRQPPASRTYADVVTLHIDNGSEVCARAYRLYQSAADLTHVPTTPESSPAVAVT